MFSFLIYLVAEDLPKSLLNALVSENEKLLGNRKIY